MKSHIPISAVVLLLSMSYCLSFAQEDVTIISPTSEAAEGLDLEAVSELFKDSEDLEAFEKALNDPETGVNNLDLDENGEVDFIRVIEEVSDDTHVIILQVPLGEDEYQDVATIEVEKTGDEEYNMQVHGNEDLYGPDYYMAPAVVRIHTWPIIVRIFRPAYRPYRSGYYWGYYPRWWKRYRPVTMTVYRTRTNRFRTRSTFVVTRKPRVRTVHKVKYKPRSSTLVIKKTKVVRPARKVVKPKAKTRKAVKKTAARRKKK